MKELEKSGSFVIFAESKIIYSMEKYYHIYFTLENGECLSMEGMFNDDTVIDDVREQLKSLYGDRFEEFRILEDTGTNGLDEIYDSHNDR